MTYTCYYLTIGHRKYVSTDITEITAYSLYLGVLGCTEVGITDREIPTVEFIYPF